MDRYLVNRLKHLIEEMRRVGDDIRDRVAAITADEEKEPRQKDVLIRRERQEARRKVEALNSEINGLVTQVGRSIDASRRASRGTTEARGRVQALLAQGKSIGDVVKGARKAGDAHMLQAVRAVAPFFDADEPEVLEAVDQALLEIGADDHAAQASAVGSTLHDQGKKATEYALAAAEGKDSVPSRLMSMGYAQNEAKRAEERVS